MIERPAYWQSATITHSLSDVQRPHWERALEPYRDGIKSVLEVGSYEGQSALFWSHHFDAAVTCIDTWATFAEGCTSCEEVERHFDENVRGRKIFKLKGPSILGLTWLSTHDHKFDLAYIDGDHHPDQVMIDSIIAWKCLRLGGIMIWDDYHEATTAIDFFRDSRGAKEIECTYQQMMVQKVVETNGLASRDMDDLMHCKIQAVINQRC